MVLVSGHLQDAMETSPLCLVFSIGNPSNLWWHQFPRSSVGDDFNNNNFDGMTISVIPTSVNMGPVRCNEGGN